MLNEKRWTQDNCPVGGGSQACANSHVLQRRQPFAVMVGRAADELPESSIADDIVLFHFSTTARLSDLKHPEGSEFREHMRIDKRNRSITV
jgi:hypothetical protein